MQAIEQIKQERINTLSLFRNKEGQVKEGYICTMHGEEIELDKHFFSQYEIQEIWNVKRNEYGYVQSSYDYKIIEKNTGKTIFEQ